MKRFNLLFLTPILFLFGCKGDNTSEESEYKSLYSPRYTSNFIIEGESDKSNTIINVFDPWQGAKNVSKKFKIIREEKEEREFSGQSIYGEARRIVCMSSTHIAMLDALGEVDRVVGVSGKEYISNDYIRSHAKEIADVGYEGNMNYEALIAAKPDLVLLFSINGASSLEKHLEEFKIPYLYIGDYVEEDPLGKTEWIVAVGEVVGLREKADSIFQEKAHRYEALKEMIGSQEKNSPKVMLNTPFADAWFMPSVSSYVAKMVNDAGGDYVYKKDTGSTSRPIDMEEAFKYLSEADLWLNVGQYDNMEDIKKDFPRFAKMDCVKQNNVYNNNLRKSPGGGNDAYESGVVNPDILLRDLIKIFHPEKIEEEFTYYHRLAPQ